ncbi:TonB-dependent siderophore receptor [Puniceibacterium sp. IMCC21224]|uniref:TonB-dependent receptor plug domain-containing protein n=1 Tax=Puniceibacterium sp. IMCC21224 TaxID=1618204 RepID=UPI00064DB15D|nr:TonB-dependent receptor [Puniceibacterium sp. IMCC21224]KMK66662.1 outer membrane cobalamin receptor protein [Puniceibacterium sp. IMCC21224]
MTRLLCSASLFALATLPAPSYAQEVMDLDVITVFANQTETALDHTGASVEVVTEEDLKLAPTTRLVDYLDTLPGVSVSSNGGLGTGSTLRLRGLSGAYVPVLINGIDVTDPSSTQTQFDWGSLTLGNIGRIEVVKGSQSAVYGSEAIGGVISITTAQIPDEIGTQIDTNSEFGTDNTRSATVNIGTRTERAGLSFGLSRTQSDGISARSDAGFDEDDGFDGKRLTFDGYYDVTDTLRIGLSGYALDADADFDDGPFAAKPEGGETQTQTRAIRAYAELTTGTIDHSFSVSRFTIDRTSTAGGFADPFGGTRNRVDYKGTWHASQALTLSFGADWTREEAMTTGAVYDPVTFARSGSASTESDSTIAGVFAEALYAPTDKLDLTLSLRHDDHSDFGGATSARAALAWRPLPDLTVRALLSNGFRAPSLYELYNPTYGNATLDPEVSRNAELGVEKSFAGGARVQATLFYTEIDDLIQYFDPDGYLGPIAGGYNQVTGTTKTRGLELSGAVPLSDRVSVSGAFTYTDSRDALDDPQLRIPRYDLALGVQAQLSDALRGGLSVQRIVDRPDDFGTPLPDYTLWGANLAYEITDTAEVYLRVENLTDQDYVTSGGYNSPGRSVFFGINASF